LTGKSTKAHARYLRPANNDNWEIPKDKVGRHLRKSVYVAPLDESEDYLTLMFSFVSLDKLGYLPSNEFPGYFDLHTYFAFSLVVLSFYIRQ
jgi:hypothetical protein